MDKKRPILLQGAMEVEINYFKEVITDIEEVTIYGYEFLKGNFEGYPIIISKTKVGLIEASIATFIGITNFNPILVINQGTAGACTKNLHIGDIVIGDKCININSYITKPRKEKQGSIPLEGELLTFKDGKDELLELNADEELRNIAIKRSNSYNVGKVICGTIGSGDVWDNEIDRIKWFNEKYMILCEDMETISTYSICNKLNIPTVGIRVISDNEITNEKYDKNIAIEAQKYVIEIVKELVRSIDK